MLKPVDAMENKTLRIFVSNTSADLWEVREIISKALMTSGCLPVSQDTFAPDHQTVEKLLRSKIKECHAIIHVVGHRYGAEPNISSLPSGKKRRSYTQMEFEIANRLGLKIYTFICPADFPYSTFDSKGEAVAIESAEKRALQLQYRNELLQRDHTYSKISDHSEISNRIREVQIDLDNLRSKVKSASRRLGMVAAGIVFLLTILIAGVVQLKEKSSKIISNQADTSERANMQLNASRVMHAYQALFRDQASTVTRDGVQGNIVKEIEDDAPFLIAEMLNLDPGLIEEILAVEIPRLSYSTELRFNLKLAALFVAGYPEETIELARSSPEKLNDTGLVTIGDAHTWLNYESPNPYHLEESTRYYRAAMELASIESRRVDEGRRERALASAYFNLSNFSLAAKHYRSAYETLSGAIGDGDPEVLDCLSSYAVTLDKMHDSKPAARAFEKVIAGRIELYGESDTSTLRAKLNFASFNADNGNIAVSKKYIDTVQLVYQGLENRKKDDLHRNLELTKVSLDLAEEEFLRARERLTGLISLMNRSSVEKSSEELLEAEHLLANVLSELGEFDEAENLLEKVSKIRRKTLGARHEKQIFVQNSLALVYLYREEYALALTTLNGAKEDAVISQGEQSPILVNILCNLAVAEMGLGQMDQAYETLKSSVLMSEEIFGREHPVTALAVRSMGEFHLRRGENDKALKHFRFVYNSRLRIFGKNHRSTLDAATGYAKLLEEINEFAVAEELFRFVYEQRKLTFGDSVPRTLLSGESLAGFLSDQGRFEDALIVMGELVTGYSELGKEGNSKHHFFVYQQGALSLHTGRAEKAVAYFRSALESARAAGDEASFPKYFGGLADALCWQGGEVLEELNFDLAANILSESVYHYQNSDRSWVERTLAEIRLASALDGVGNVALGLARLEAIFRELETRVVRDSYLESTCLYQIGKAKFRRQDSKAALAAFQGSCKLVEDEAKTDQFEVGSESEPVAERFY